MSQNKPKKRQWLANLSRAAATPLLQRLYCQRYSFGCFLAARGEALVYGLSLQTSWKLIFLLTVSTLLPPSTDRVLICKMGLTPYRHARKLLITAFWTTVDTTRTNAGSRRQFGLRHTPLMPQSRLSVVRKAHSDVLLVPLRLLLQQSPNAPSVRW